MLYMFLAEGFEETEAIGCLDVIRRAGIAIKTVGINGKTVQGSHGISVVADIEKNEIDFDNMQGVILPGGMPGTENLENDADVIKAIKFCADKGLLIGAICAAPMVFGRLGLLMGKKAVCFPGFEEYLEGVEVKTDLCVTDGNIITAKGAGAAMIFGARIVDYFADGEGEKLLRQMQHLRMEG